MRFLFLEPWNYLSIGSTYRALNTERAMRFQNVGLFFLLGSFLLLPAFAPELLPATFILGNNLVLGIYAAYLILSYAVVSFYLKSNPFPYLLTFVNGIVSELLLFSAKVLASILGGIFDIMNDLFCQESEDLDGPDEYRASVTYVKSASFDGAGMGSTPTPLPLSPAHSSRHMQMPQEEEEKSAAQEHEHGDPSVQESDQVLAALPAKTQYHRKR